MERKMFGPGGRFGSPKQRVLKMFRLIRGSGSVSSYTDSNEEQTQISTYNPQGHKIAHQRMHEIETIKAMMIAQSRHERWKAGGPV